MRSILPYAGVLLALFTVGCIGFIAWELTKEAERDGQDDDSSKDQ